ncbi:MAG: ATP-binding protein [Chloroflexi bacterium]|nr:ATP-binding protein [Chloroflexota bacterium]
MAKDESTDDTSSAGSPFGPVIALFKDAGGVVAAVAALISGVAALMTLVQSQPLAAGIAAVLAAFFAACWWMIRRHNKSKGSEPGNADSAAIRRLQPFEEGEGRLLSSRDEDVAALRTLVLARDFEFGMLYGDPNSGKTSVVRARLLPEVRTRKPAESIDNFGTGPKVLEDPLAVGLRRALKLEDASADLPSLVNRLSAQPDTRVLIVWDNFDHFYSDVPDQPQRLQALSALRTMLDGLDGQLGILVVASTDFRQCVADDYARVFGRNLTAEYALARLSTAVASKTLKDFVEHDARLGFPRLSRGVCDRIARGLEHDGTVCPAELQIVADRLRAQRRYTEDDLDAAGGVDGVLIQFFEEQLAAASDGDGITRRILELLSQPPQAVGRLTPEGICAQISPAPDDVLRKRVSIALESLVENDLAIRLHTNEYSLVHAYMAPYARQAVKGWAPPTPPLWTRLRAAAPKAAALGGLGLAALVGCMVLGSWLLWGPQPSGYLERPGSPLLWQNLVAIDPTNRFVLAAAAGNQLALWDRQSASVTGDGSQSCAANPHVLSVRPPVSEASGSAPTGLQMFSAGFNRDGTQFRAVGTSVGTNQVWVATLTTSDPCADPVWSWGDYASHPDEQTVCTAVDAAYSDSLQAVAVAYGPLPGARDSGACDRVADYPVSSSVGPGAPVVGPPAAGQADALSTTGHRTEHPPAKVIFDPSQARLLTLTKGDNQQFIEILEAVDANLSPTNPPQPVRYGTPYDVVVSKGHTDIVLQDDAGPFWTRPISTWLSVSQDAYWVANWDSDVNQLKSWIGGISRTTPPAVGISPDGGLIIEIGDSDQYPVYEMYGHVGPFRFQPFQWP